MIDFTKPVQTHDGLPVEILTTQGRNPEYPVLGYRGDERYVSTWSQEGKYTNNTNHGSHLMNVPEKVTLSGYLNVYPSSRKSHIYDTRLTADSYAAHNRIACIKVDFPYVEEWFEEDDHSYSRQAWNEKFAELLIKGCAHRVENTLLGRVIITDPDDVLSLAATQLKEHFGVK